MIGSQTVVQTCRAALARPPNADNATPFMPELRELEFKFCNGGPKYRTLAGGHSQTNVVCGRPQTSGVICFTSANRLCHGVPVVREWNGISGKISSWLKDDGQGRQHWLPHTLMPEL